MASQPVSTEPTGWTGWIVFASVFMVIGGALAALQGFVALVNDSWVGWQNADNAFLDVSSWGWVHLIVGLIVLIAGFGVWSGNVLARTVGVIVATISLIVNFLYIPVFPLWAMTIIVIDALVIWALTAHGSEMQQV